MSINCPQCNSELITSAVGFMCPDCGSLHHFYKTGGVAPKTPENPQFKPSASIDNSNHTETPKHPLPKRMKMLLARLVIPELPSPHDSEQLLETHLEPVTRSKSSNPLTLPASTPSKSPMPSAPNRVKHFNARWPLIILGLLLLIVIGGGITYMTLVKKPNNQTNNAEQTPKEDVVTKSKSESEKSERDIKRKQDIKEIATALEVYKKDVGTYPVGNQIQVTYVLSKASPKYINYVNEDPLSSKENHVYYSYRSDGQSFILSTKLENPNDGEAVDGYYIIQSNQ